MTKREQVRIIGQLILETDDETEKTALRNWRDSILGRAELVPEYSKYIFNATMKLYERSIENGSD